MMLLCIFMNVNVQSVHEWLIFACSWMVYPYLGHNFKHVLYLSMNSREVHVKCMFMNTCKMPVHEDTTSLTPPLLPPPPLPPPPLLTPPLTKPLQFFSQSAIASLAGTFMNNSFFLIINGSSRKVRKQFIFWANTLMIQVVDGPDGSWANFSLFLFLHLSPAICPVLTCLPLKSSNFHGSEIRNLWHKSCKWGCIILFERPKSDFFAPHALATVRDYVMLIHP